MTYTKVTDPLTGFIYNVKPVPGKPEGVEELLIVVDDTGESPVAETIERISRLYFGRT